MGCSRNYYYAFDVDNEKVFEYEAALVEGPNGVKWCPNRIPTVKQYSYNKVLRAPQLHSGCLITLPRKKKFNRTLWRTGVHWMYRDDDPAAFDKQFPYKGPVTTMLNNEPKYGIIPGVDQP